MTSEPRPISNDPDTGSLDARLQQALASVSPTHVRIATAYLTPDGFLLLKEGLKGAESVRMLLGERPFLNRRGPSDVLRDPGEDNNELQGPDEAIDWYTFLEGGYPWLLLTHDERAELLRRGEDPAKSAFDLSAWERVRALVDFLRRDNVLIRRFLGADAGKVASGAVLDHTSSHAKLHAKAYLFSGPVERFAAVGSSNLTRGGLQQNVELNLVSSSGELVDDLAAWFDRKWDQGQDCKEELVQRLEECVLFGRRYTPWQVLIKSLHAAYGHFLEVGLSEDIAERLAGFQQHAVQRCTTLLERHWGAMLCDSVGLGKTYEGLGILAEFSRRRDGRTRALVVCPAQLEGNWSQERFVQYGISAETVTMESLPQLVDLDEVQSPLDRARRSRRLRHYQDHFDIVLVDESHNFRNSETKRYRALLEVIRGGKPDKRVVLLTATPINNSVWDLYTQLMLITRGDDAWYAGRGPVGNLRATFRAVARGEGGVGLLDTMMLSLVRRTRHDIRAMQQAGEEMEVGGQPLRFPQHEIPRAIGYSLQDLYGDIYRDVIDAVEHLNFAVYQLESYGVDTGERDTEERLRQRNANFVGIMRTILLKRMESSVAALTSTVESMIDYLELFLARMGEAKIVTPRQAHRLRAVLGGSLPDADLETADWDPRALEAMRELRAAPADAEEMAALYAAVDEDRARLTVLLERLKWLEAKWEGSADPKAAQVRALIDSLPPTDARGTATKVVIFTNYRDTAEYLFHQLGGGSSAAFRRDGLVRVRSNLKESLWMSVLTGADDAKRRAAVLERFAPLSTHRDAEPIDDPALADKIRPYREEGIDLLIATDVLSEGQNLQDAQYLINYDLHWNPVRMIQRAGRIDRLYSPHEKVFIFNVMPEQGLEDLLRLVGRLTRKLETIEDAIALDASVLGEQIEAKELDKIMALRAGGKKADDVYLEGERTQGLDAGLEVLNRYLDIMRETATEELREIPNGVYSVREGSADGVYVMLRMPEEASGEVYWRFYPGGDTAHPLSSPNDVLDLIAADRETVRLDVPDLNPFTHLRAPLEATVSQIAAEYATAMAAQGPDILVTKVKRLLQRDDLLRTDGELWNRLSDWANWPHPSDTMRRGAMAESSRIVNRLKGDATVEDAVEALRRLWTAIEGEGLDRPMPRPMTPEPSARDLELVAWELVVNTKKRAEPST